jgi:chemotaxis protein histidine kinase CheA
VRVAVDKLDRLLAQAGELAVTQIRIEQRLSELRELRRDLQDWRREWRGARGLRAGLSRATVPTASGAGTSALATETPLDDTLGRELRILLRFTERAE